MAQKQVDKVLNEALKPKLMYFGTEIPYFHCGFGESIVDETNWRPDAVRNNLLSPQSSLGASSIGVYDFEDGKDTGFRPFRELGADITEIDNAMKRITDEAERKELSEKQKAEARKELADAMSEALGMPSAETEVSDS